MTSKSCCYLNREIILLLYIRVGIIMEKDYLEKFTAFLTAKRNMVSTYKGTFLYALTDIEFYDQKNLVGGKWIQKEGNKIKIDLNFIAMRLLYYYWEISNSEIRHTYKKIPNIKNPNQDINIIEELKRIEKTKQVPNLQELANDDMSELRKTIIRDSLPEPLDHLRREFTEIVFKILPDKKSIEIDVDLVEFMKKNSDYVRDGLKVKIKNHLEDRNKKLEGVEVITTEDNPFYLYVKEKNLLPGTGKRKNIPFLRDYEKYGGRVQDLPEDIVVTLEKGTALIRKGQTEFRRIILDNYHHRCAICDIREDDLLEASHIIEVKNKDTAGLLKNGICLCVLHHKMFDKGYLYFDDDYILQVSEKARQSKQLLKSCTYDKITNCDLLPSKEYLKSHREKLRFMS